MSKRAEEAALKAYPIKLMYKDYYGDDEDVNIEERVSFQEGYEQAEKDLAPLIEAATIAYEAWNGGTMDDVRRAMDELGKRIKEAKK